MIEAHKIDAVAPYIDTVVNFFPSRSERINLTSTAQFARKDAKVLNDVSLELDPFYSGVLLREAQSNMDAVTQLYLSEVSGLISCCPKEQEVTIWDPFTLNVWGVINLNSPTRDLKWAFPVEAIESKKKKDLQLMQHVIKEVEMPVQIEIDPDDLKMESSMSQQKAGRRKIEVKPIEQKKTIDLHNYHVVNDRENMVLEKLTRQIKKQEKSIAKVAEQ